MRVCVCLRVSVCVCVRRFVRVCEFGLCTWMTRNRIPPSSLGCRSCKDPENDAKTVCTPLNKIPNWCLQKIDPSLGVSIALQDELLKIAECPLQLALGTGGAFLSIPPYSRKKGPGNPQGSSKRKKNRDSKGSYPFLKAFFQGFLSFFKRPA